MLKVKFVLRNSNKQQVTSVLIDGLHKDISSDREAKENQEKFSEAFRALENVGLAIGDTITIEEA